MQIDYMRFGLPYSCLSCRFPPSKSPPGKGPEQSRERSQKETEMKTQMKIDNHVSLRLSIAPIAAALTLAITAPLGAQVGKKPAHRITFKVPIGDEKKDEKKASPFTAVEQDVDGRKWGIVLANGKGVMGIPVDAGGFTPLKRAQLISDRMGKLYQGGAKFKQAAGYVVGKLNGEIVLALKPAQDAAKLELVLTIDSNLDKLLNAHAKGKPASRADIAFFWRDILIKALQDQPDIAAAPGDKNAWAKVPAGYAQDKSLTPLTDSQISGPTKLR